MATTNSGAFTISREGTIIGSDGATRLSLQYVGASGHVITERQLSIPADATQPITDQFGTHVTATVPSALANAITAFLSALDSEIAMGAGAGKLDL